MKRITKKAKREFIKHKLSTDSRWMTKTLIMLYKRQTHDEKQNDNTYFWNARGFDNHDVVWMSPIAKMLLRHKRIDLTKEQFLRLSNRLPRYWRQVLDVCNKEQLEKLIVEKF